MALIEPVQFCRATSEIGDSVGMDRFWAGYSRLWSASGDISYALLRSGRNSTVLQTKLSAFDHEISQAKERVKPCGVFGKPKVANPLHTPGTASHAVGQHVLCVIYDMISSHFRKIQFG